MSHIQQGKFELANAVFQQPRLTSKLEFNTCNKLPLPCSLDLANIVALLLSYHDGGYIEEVDRTSVGVYYAEIAGPQ